MKLVLFASSLAIAACSITAATAAPVLSSAADAASVTITAANVLRADALFAPVSATAPPTYVDTATLVQIDQSAVLVTAGLGNAFTSAEQALTSGVVATRAYAGSSSATGAAEIANADLSLGTSSVISLTALGITADAITSTTTAGFTASGLYATGDSTIANLGVGGSVLGLLSIDGSLFAHAAPNTILLDSLGIVITLNEQGTLQSATSISMFTNAIHVSLTDFLLDGELLSGDIILGHSQASVLGFSPSLATPEPATWAMMIVGFGAVGMVMRGQRRDRTRGRRRGPDTACG